MSNILIALGAIALVLILIYNSLVSKKNQVENIFASVDAMLKKRYDLIPNIVASLSRYMQHEKELLERVTALRTSAIKPDISDTQKISLDSELSKILGSIMVAVENYPDLKASENIMHLQLTLNEVEEQISAARRAYNQAVTDYNNALEMIPTNFMASLMHYTKKELFIINENERKNISVKELFN